MTEQHPITPPPELVQQWVAATESNDCIGALPTNFEQRICTTAARWGADQELQACCEWLQHTYPDGDQVEKIWTYRRPKPQSLKEKFTKVIQSKDFDAALRLVEELND